LESANLQSLVSTSFSNRSIVSFVSAGRDSFSLHHWVKLLETGCKDDGTLVGDETELQLTSCDNNPISIAITKIRLI
jgi:hypothetical protein